MSDEARVQKVAMVRWFDHINMYTITMLLVIFWRINYIFNEK